MAVNNILNQNHTVLKNQFLFNFCSWTKIDVLVTVCQKSTGALKQQKFVSFFGWANHIRQLSRRFNIFHGRCDGGKVAITRLNSGQRAVVVIVDGVLLQILGFEPFGTLGIETAVGGAGVPNFFGGGPGGASGRPRAEPPYAVGNLNGAR